MIIVNQWRNKAIILRNVFEISIEEVTEFEVTQTGNVSKREIGSFMIRVTYITPYMMENTACCPIIDEIGVYADKQTAEHIFDEIIKNYKNSKKVYYMPECPFE